MSRLALASAFALAGTAAIAAPVARMAPAAAAHDWAATVSTLPDGAFVLGNPKAKVRLTEYLSLTCTHCAHFEGEAVGPLVGNYVRKGLVAIEVRHALRDSLDFTASLLLRCDGPRAFFTNLPVVFALQDKWLNDAVAFQNADQGAAAKLPLSQALAAMAHGSGLDRIMAAHGLPPARGIACLASKPEQDRLAAMAKEAWETRNIPGTPAFAINGTIVPDVTTWEGLEPKLKAALS